MGSPQPNAARASHLWRKALGIIGKSLRHVLQVLLISWASLAIYYSALPWTWARVVLAIAFAVFGIWALWFVRSARSIGAFALAFVIVAAWWATIQPSHDRNWAPEVAVMPRAQIEGDRIRIEGVRDFKYESRENFTPRYKTREVLLSNLVAVDFYISYWMPGPIGHTFLSFVFSDAPPLSVSIEVRPESTEGYSPIGSLFKQFELIYVVGEEPDIVGVRTNHRDEDVYLYRIRAEKENARRLFLIYMQRINELADHPEFYHLLSNSCTVNIVRYAGSIGSPMPFDIRYYLNGLADRALYRDGRLSTSVSFEDLRQRSLINEPAQAAVSSPDFSERIRASLPFDSKEGSWTKAAL
jgi:hypothetical protein